MADECTDQSSVATSSTSTPNWWDLHNSTSHLPSWNINSNNNNNNNTGSTTTTSWHPPNPNSNSSCEEDVSISTSFTNASNHSGLSSVDSSRRLVEPANSSNEFMGETTASDHSNLWSHVLLGVGSNGELQDSPQDVGENLLEALSSKSLSTGMFQPACDSLIKKLDNTWEFTGSTSFNNFDKHINGFTDNLIESDQRLTKLSTLVSNWSIAPPDPEVNHQFEVQPCNISLGSSTDHHHYYSNPSFSDSTSCGVGPLNKNSGLFSCYGSDYGIRQETDHPPDVRTSFNSNSSNGYHQYGHGSSMVGDKSKYYYSMPGVVPGVNSRNFSDVISFSGRLSRPLLDGTQSSKPFSKSLSLSADSKKQVLQSSNFPIRNSGRGHVSSSDAKKKRSEDNSADTILKKPKHENTAVSSLKVQAPKVKIGERITALQQIVSPFGKTDTASVLLEAIGYIRFLQEQVQLLSNPYMKTNASMDHPWGGLDRKDKEELKLELKSRGLCLVPISCTPQIYRENTGSDYWTPTYRGCLYR